MGTYAAGVFRRKGRALPLKMPPQVPDYFSDFAHDSDLADWLTTVGGVWSITNKALRQSSVLAAGYNAYVSRGPVFGDHLYEARIRAIVPGVNFWEVPLAILRYQDALNFYFCGFYTNNFVVFERMVAGVPVNFAVWPMVALVTDWHHYRIYARGYSFAVYFDGTYMGTATDPASSFATGRSGVRTSASSAEFDDLLIKAPP